METLKLIGNILDYIVFGIIRFIISPYILIPIVGALIYLAEKS